METVALVLAAGEGTRMKSDTPKVLHPLLDRPILAYVLRCVHGAGIERVAVVIGHKGEKVSAYLSSTGCEPVIQEEQLGTGHAVMAASELLSGFDGTVFVVSGDTPLLRSETVRTLLEEHERAGAAATILTSVPAEPYGYGRIVRNEHGGVVKIVEQRDATPEQLEIRETNSSIYCFDSKKLYRALERLDTDNSQGEYYLTDVIEILAADGQTVASCVVEDFTETLGINSREQLAEALEVLQQRVNDAWMAEGVTIMSPTQTWVGVDVNIGRDSRLLPQTYLLGDTTVGDSTTIGPNVRVFDSSVGSRCTIEQAEIERSTIEDEVNIGPFCRVHPGSVLKKGSETGAFAEMNHGEAGMGDKARSPKATDPRD